MEGVGLRLNVVAEVKVASWQQQGRGLMLSALIYIYIYIYIYILWVCCFPLKPRVLQNWDFFFFFFGKLAFTMKVIMVVFLCSGFEKILI